MDAQVDFDVVIIGSGFSGIGMAVALQASGRSYTVLEKAHDIGGTWRDNRYPGCACDVPSHLYSFSFEPNPYWSRAYATSDEIQDYLLYVVEKYDVRKDVQFDAQVTRGVYDESLSVWHLTVLAADGEEQHLVAGAVVLGVGALHDPSLPDIPGLESFAGEIMHTATWDPGASMFGRKVGIIGTGASAVQAIPYLAQDADHLTVFQRTPAWVLPKIDPEYPESLHDAYEKRPWLMKAHRAKIQTWNEIRGYAFSRAVPVLKAYSLLARANIAKAVKDPKLRRKLTPSYTLGCKRVTFSSTYYPALARENVHVETESVATADAMGLTTVDGTRHELDVLVLATGFDVTGSYRHLGFTGSGGHDLAHEWDRGITSYYGVTVPHFPNLFFLLGPNTALGHNSVVLMIEAQIALTVKLLDERDERGAGAIEVREAVAEAHLATLDRRTSSSVWAIGGCNSWYLDELGRNRTLWPGSVPEYERRTRRPEMIDYEFTGSPNTATVA